MEHLLALDNGLFELIAVTLKNGFFDVVMPLLSDAKFWKAPLLGLALGLLVFGKKKGLKAVILCGAAVGLSDAVCGNILQPLINRPRPLGGVTASFPSCHAANTFAAAFVISYMWRKLWVRWLAFGIAAAVAYSRIYTTSHYPADVSAGAVIGVGFALLAVSIYNKIETMAGKKRQEAKQ